MVEQNNSLGVILTISWVLVFLIGSEVFARWGKISKESARKIIHISVGNVIFFIPLFSSAWYAAIIPFTFIIGNYLLSPVSPFKKLKLSTFEAGHAWGTIFYPLTLTILVLIFYSEPFFIIACFFPLVYGDGLAAVIGPNTTSGHFTTFSGTKTRYGTITVFLGTFISIIIGAMILDIYLNGLPDYQTIIFLGFVFGLIATSVELFSYPGTDNLSIPIVLMLITFLLQDFNMIGY